MKGHLEISSSNSAHFANALTHLPFFKMATISQTIQFSMKNIPQGSIDSKSALVQVMACRLLGDNPLPEPMLTQFTNAYIWH